MSNITTQAQRSIEELTNQSMRSAFSAENMSAWEIGQLHDSNSIQTAEFYMLTIVSYVFRAFVLLHFTNDSATRNYVASSIKLKTQEITDTRFHDYIGEMGNAFCGAFKRDLGEYYTHTGMSTPNRLSHQSFLHLQRSNFDYALHLKALNKLANTQFIASVLINTYENMDFNYIRPANNSNSGELELF